MFDDEGNAYVADLGVDEIFAGIITFTTTAYDAPQRLGGILATPAADVYSLGVLLQQLLSVSLTSSSRVNRASQRGVILMCPSLGG